MTITVGQLKEILAGYNDEMLIVMSRDSEGNGFSPLADHGKQIYVPDSTWSGDIYEIELTAELIEQGFTTDELYDGDDGVQAIVLWPTN